ncbi:hypothetical protein ABZ260_16985 [Streptosporangium sp. NPDC006013]|uniref:hypothetical protein n=1 Tax=Streptosporangium sp. NPDC006013 TaxID=3155596 RepID=UPI0033B36EB8
MSTTIGFFYFTTRFLQGVLGFDPLRGGLAFLPMTAVDFAVALQIPALTRRDCPHPRRHGLAEPPGRRQWWSPETAGACTGSRRHPVSPTG